jgi:hypothetical protein
VRNLNRVVAERFSLCHAIALTLSCGSSRDTAGTDHYGDAELGIPFTASVECELNCSIYKGDYCSFHDTEGISIGELNDHYYDADQDYIITIARYITVMIDPTDLESDGLTDEDLQDLINDAPTSTEVTEREVFVPDW